MYAFQANRSLTGPGSDLGRFAAAARHSRRVRALRIAIPVVVALALLVIIGASVFNPWRMLAKLPLEMGNLVVSGTKITMESPRMAGFTPDGRAYEVSARTAAQDVTNPNQLDLQDLRAKIDMEDKSTVQMTALKGLYDTKAEILKLNDNILLVSSAGYEGRLKEALVNIREGSVVSKMPVSIKFLNGNLEAQTMSVIEHGAVARFEGGVSMTLTLNQKRAEGDTPGASP